MGKSNAECAHDASAVMVVHGTTLPAFSHKQKRPAGVPSTSRPSCNRSVRERVPPGSILAQTRLLAQVPHLFFFFLTMRSDRPRCCVAALWLVFCAQGKGQQEVAGEHPLPAVRCGCSPTVALPRERGPPVVARRVPPLRNTGVLEPR